METALITQEDERFTKLIEMVENCLDSRHSKRAYRTALEAFKKWYDANGQPGLNKAVVMAYRQTLLDSGKSSSTINVQLSAIRKLAKESANNGWLSESVARGIEDANGVSSKGVRSGNWLTEKQAQELLDITDTETLKGVRDKALLAVLLGAGLRRSEVSALTMNHIQQREGRWAIVDIIGKGNRVRTVPIAPWVKDCIDDWTTAAGITGGYVFRSLNRKAVGESISDQAVGDMVKGYLPRIAAHDLRRTFAKLSRDGGCPLEQIQINMGHQSLQTTRDYLGTDLSYTEAPSDFIKLHN